MATTLDVIVDRVRSLCVASPFEYQESARLDRFEWDPAQGFGDVSYFRVETVSQPPRGGTSFTEERTDLLTVTVGRAINADYDVARRVLTRFIPFCSPIWAPTANACWPFRPSKRWRPACLWGQPWKALT